MFYYMSAIKKLILFKCALAKEVLVTVSGILVSFITNKAKPAISVLDSIEPIQDLHGYDKPWSGGNGKNKANIDDSENGGIDSNGNNVVDANNWRSISLIPIQSGQAYTLHAVGMAITRLYFYDANGDFISPRIVSQTDTVTATAPSNAKYAKWTIYKTGITIADVQSAKMQLELGSSATSFEPYSNICPISGHTEVVTSRCGANVWDEEWELGYYNNTDGGKTNSNNCIRCKNKISVQPNTTYFFHSPNRYSLRFYDAQDGYLGRGDYASYAKDTEFTTPNGCYYVCFYMEDAYGTTYNHDISINYPSTDHDYHAYNGTQYTTDLGQTVYGGTLDVVSGLLTVDKAIVDLGTLTWISETSALSGVFRSPAALWNPFPMYLGELICSQYKGVKNPSFRLNDGEVSMTNSQSVPILRVRDETKTSMTAEEFQAAMYGVQLVYELATPQTYQLTPQEVALLKGQNNLWCDSGEIEVRYIG